MLPFFVYRELLGLLSCYSNVFNIFKVLDTVLC